MQNIYKYTIPTIGQSRLNLPRNANILSVQNQHDKITLWALVDTSEPNETRFFEVYGTGQPCPYADRQQYIGTVQIAGLVWHVFEAV